MPLSSIAPECKAAVDRLVRLVLTRTILLATARSLHRLKIRRSFPSGPGDWSANVARLSPMLVGEPLGGMSRRNGCTVRILQGACGSLTVGRDKHERKPDACDGGWRKGHQ
jgi:hypothetical protein